MDEQIEPVGLWICERIIVEAGTMNVSLVSVFTGRRYPAFPTDPIPFSLFAVVTGGRGQRIIRLKVIDTSDAEAIHDQVETLEFPDPATHVNVHFRLSLRFPDEGTYSFGLFAHDELICERQLRVYA